MKTLKNDWLIWTIITVPFIFVAMFWSQFPDQIPTHFSFDGRPDDYKGKVFGLLFLPSINVAVYFFYLSLPLIDPARKNHGLFQDKFKIMRTIIHAFLVYMFFITALFSLGYPFNMRLLIFYGILVLFLVLGNYMGTIRPNYFIGIRTPWTRASEQVWMKTHRITAIVWVSASLLTMILLAFVSETIAPVIFITYLVLITLIPVVYSFVEFKKQKHEQEKN
jgi:uncharacterized membrane protein